MARAGTAAVVLAFAVCCFLVAPAPARQPVDAPRQLPHAVDREAAAEKLLPQTAQVAADDAEAAEDQATAIVVQEEGDPVVGVQEEESPVGVQEKEGPVGEERPHQKRSSLLCLVFRCGGGAEPTGAGRVAVARGRWQALKGWAQLAVRWTAEEQGAHDSDSDWDTDHDSDSDSDDEHEGGIVGWFWRLADGF